MMKRLFLSATPFLCYCLSLVAGGLAAIVHADEGLVVEPATITLASPEARQQLLVGLRERETYRDVTRAAQYQVADPSVVSVSDSGVVTPLHDGATSIDVSVGDWRSTMDVLVDGFSQPQPISFDEQIVPLLAKAGCSSGGCHGKAEGQNGFRLSIFGSDAQFDFDALVKQGRGRRLQPAAPERSLLLRKATGDLPHGGGRRLAHDDHRYRRVLRWISEGAAWHDAGDHRVISISVKPDNLVLDANQTQQLQVTATDAGGRTQCVTLEAEYQSNADVIAEASADGLVSITDVPGAAAILIRYMGHVTVCRVTHPRKGAEFARPAENNFIDGLVWDRLAELGIGASDHCDDATFLRRAFLDTIGTLPTANESRAFLDDPENDKRQRLIDHLLQRSEYADYWAMIWGDLLGADKESLTPQGAVALSRWLRAQFRENRPYDEFATDIVAARGDPTRVGAAGFYTVHKTPERMGKAVSQIFLGVRIECAQCHHHPFERWSQADYYSFAGIFTGVKALKSSVGPTKIVGGLPKPLAHPKTKELTKLAPLGGETIDETAGDPRRQLAKWMAGDANPFFAKAMVNRLWAHYFGRGLVDPVDDIRATNPATNERLLDELAKYFVKSGYDIHAVTRLILESEVYQRSSSRNVSNTSDDQNYSSAPWKPLPAEVLLDAICAATDVPEEFNGWPAGYRAIQIWDNRLPSYFFQAFGRPQRVSVCDCERGTEPSVAQALHMMNAPETVAKLTHRDGRAAKLAASDLLPPMIIEELYLTALSRRPSAEETRLMLSAFAADNPDDQAARREAVEDILWALLNTKEFIYNH
jgi:hypothetical protein